MMTLLERLRRDMGWSQEDLSRESGCDRPMISQYESGKRFPTENTCAKLAAALRVRAAVLIADFAQRSEQAS